MEKMNIREIAAAIGAEYDGDGVVTAISSDTRDLPEGCLFVALKGENFDGHTFLQGALEQGAGWAVSMEPAADPQGRILLVKDTRQAMLDLAGLYRRQLGIKVVGVTGSVGKTTTKEMVACALSAGMKTGKNEANLNNEIGLSQTVFGLDAGYEAAVLEMGMDGPGQIRPLSMSVRPDVGIVTNIGVSHMEALGSRENILREKLSIADGMPDGATLILCADNDLLQTVEDGRHRILLYGIENPKATVRAAHIKEFSTHTTFEILYDRSRFDAQVPCMGRHNVLNALAAFSAAVSLDIAPQDAIAALKNYKPAGMRQNIVVHNSFTVVEDCYNASPDSMKAALTTLGKLECDGKRIAVLSDMLELGAVEQEAHRDCGRLAAECRLDWLLCTGERSRWYVEGAKAAGMDQAKHFPSQEALFETLKELLEPGDVVWFKASRSMKLEQLISRIYKEC